MAHTPLRFGTKLGPWTLDAQRGSGKFSIVYDAHAHTGAAVGGQSNSFALKVALKYEVGSRGKPKKDLSIGALLLGKEYQQYVALRNLGITRPALLLLPNDAYGQDDVHAWLAMPRLGLTMEQRMQAAGGGLPWTLLVSAALRLCDVLRALHGAALSFVDISPDNVLFGLGPSQADEAFLVVRIR